jgi:putative Mg2+ transporter-C (MgtC) family protein
LLKLNNSHSIIDPLSSFSLLELCLYFGPKVFLATLCGGIVGIERELRGRVAGLKTNILICCGTTLFTASSFLVADGLHTIMQSLPVCLDGVLNVACRVPGMNFPSDPSRMIAQIIAGVGFLGAGAIFRAGDRVKGLTSAAFIWVNCAIGVLIGAGGNAIAAILTMSLLVVLLTMEKIERFLKTGAQNTLSLLHLAPQSDDEARKNSVKITVEVANTTAKEESTEGAIEKTDEQKAKEKLAHIKEAS